MSRNKIRPHQLFDLGKVGYPYRVKTLLAFIVALLSISSHASTKMFIDDPETLMRLEDKGFDFARWVLGEQLSKRSNDKMAGGALYKGLIAVLNSDLEAAKVKDPSLNVTMAGAHRLFDKRWLVSPFANYELVGIVNRVDHSSFTLKYCGEMRFIYRLAYKTPAPKSRYSRLPMTVNAVFYLARENGGCAEAAKKWALLQEALKQTREPASLSQTLGIEKLKSIEVNLQIVRWPSTVRPDFGGYAEYLLRVFTVQNGVLTPARLENTPDVESINRNTALKAELLKWLTDPGNFEKIDRGVAVLPEKFLATKAISVALQGTYRLANAPFTQIFSEKDLAGIDFKKAHLVQSSHGLLKRLNDLSCVGCHQGRTVAGFHFLGRDPKGTIAINSIAVSASGHFLGEQAFRRRILENTLSGKEDDEFRDFSVRSRSEGGAIGAHCGLGDPTFSKWTCAEGLVCERVTIDDRVSRTGVCRPKASLAGSACRVAKVSHASDPLKDGLAKAGDIACRNGLHCEGVPVGFPSGMCSGGCRDLRAGEICGKIAVLQPFNDCLARGKEPFDTCLSENVRPGALQRCSESRLCRDDYICASVDGGEGACIPPYFLFQLRLDGHPKPM